MEVRSWLLAGVLGALIVLALAPLRDAWIVNDAGVSINRALVAEAEGGDAGRFRTGLEMSMERLAAAAAQGPQTDTRQVPIWRTYGAAAALAPSSQAFELLVCARDVGLLDRWGQLWLGEVASATEHWDEASKAYQRIDASNLLLARADASLQAGQPELAVRQYNMAEASLDAAIEREIAEQLLLGKTDADPSVAASLTDLSEERVTALYRIGWGLLSAGRPAEAVAVLEEALGKTQTASPGAVVEKSLNLNLALALAQTLPDPPKYLVTPVYYSFNPDEETKAYLQIITRIRVLVNRATESDLTGPVCVQAARVLLLIGDVGSAISMLEMAIEIDPLSPDAHLALGAQYESMRMNISAREVFRKAAQQLPGNGVIAVAYALASYKSMPPAEALPLLQQTAETETNDPYLFAFLGDCYLELGLVAEARSAYEEGLRRAPRAEPLTSRLSSLEGTTETLP
jgi:tetratricopeptide (TPR) repeat protein